jgi:hypothetical protein
MYLLKKYTGWRNVLAGEMYRLEKCIGWRRAADGEEYLSWRGLTCVSFFSCSFLKADRSIDGRGGQSRGRFSVKYSTSLLSRGVLNKDGEISYLSDRTAFFEHRCRRIRSVEATLYVENASRQFSKCYVVIQFI